MTDSHKIVITGAAGLVGQNLVHRLLARGGYRIVAIDKNAHNAAILARLHPSVEVIVADVAEPGPWTDALTGADTVVSGHAQIGGTEEAEFVRNNITATQHLLDALRAHEVPYLVNISSSVVNSAAVDFYTETKKAQERMLLDSGIPQVVLRPTLMFGWFDRKHMGWLARFMKRVPVFPIPGDGRYLRQPLFVGDFCGIIIAAAERRTTGAYNISGQEKIDYIDLMRAVRRAVGARTAIVRIPYRSFWLLLKVYQSISSDPPFTTKQLEALSTPDVFEVIDWPSLFGVRATPLDEALRETFQDPVYSEVVLEF
jgi:nucleoside-diphosphate-sugar epimerase